VRPRYEPSRSNLDQKFRRGLSNRCPCRTFQTRHLVCAKIVSLHVAPLDLRLLALYRATMAS